MSGHQLLTLINQVLEMARIESGKIEYSLKKFEPRKEGCATPVFTVADTGIGMSEEYLKVFYSGFMEKKESEGL